LGEGCSAERSMTLQSGAFRFVIDNFAQSYLSHSHPPQSAIACWKSYPALHTPERERDR
jgi:hypothetical protein